MPILDEQLESLLEETQQDNGKKLYCRLCKALITTDSDRFQVGLSDQYSFTNPAGITYSIACFQQAHGCTISGLPTKEYSWFSGYQWQIASCTECHEHLGWYYENRKRAFFGLILSRVVESPD